jgi:hypothetical protein
MSLKELQDLFKKIDNDDIDIPTELKSELSSFIIRYTNDDIPDNNETQEQINNNETKKLK